MALVGLLIVLALAAPPVFGIPLQFDPYRRARNRYATVTHRFLTMPKNRPFKILQFADIHYANGADTPCSDLVTDPVAQGFPAHTPVQTPCSDLNSTAWEEWLVVNERPDLVVFTGDNIMGPDSCDNNASLWAIVEPLVRHKVPYMMIFGNHDDGSSSCSGFIPNNRAKLVEYAASLPYSLTLRGPADLHGVGNYAYNVVGARKKPLFTLYLMDSSSYDVTGNVGGYDWMRPNQVQWYNETAARQQRRLSKTIPGILFHHIPLPEVELAWHCNKANINNSFVTFTEFGSASKGTFNKRSMSGIGLLSQFANCDGYQPDMCVGVKQEGVYSPRVNPGMFAALAERNDVVMVNVGHDHVNNHCCPLGQSKIQMCYGGGFGYHAYGQAGWPRRSRVLELHANGSITTYMRLDKWSGSISFGDIPKTTTPYATLYQQTIV